MEECVKNLSCRRGASPEGPETGDMLPCRTQARAIGLDAVDQPFLKETDLKRKPFRRAGSTFLILGLLVSGLVASVPGVSSAANASLEKAACSVPKIQLERTLRGFRADHSGDIQLFTREPDYVGSGLPHIAPFDYIQDVPLVVYGPGHVNAAGDVKREVYTPDIAPTMAALVNFEGFNPPDGRVLSEALDLEAIKKDPPKLVINLVWDAAGDIILDRWPRNYPNLKKLMAEGTNYTNATIASSPASTAQIHAEMGTGAFPSNHAIVGHHYRIGETHVSPWKNPATVPILPTVADLYDRALENKPKIALSGTVAIHMGMESHGSLWGGGDKDIAILREADAALNPRGTLGMEGIEWKLSPGVEDYFTFPTYANELGSIGDFFDEVDVNDGKRDGKWFHDVLTTYDKESLGGFETSARVPYQQRLVEEVIKREDFGKDDIADMFMINYKLIDTRIHIGQGLDGPESGDALKVQDKYLGKFVQFLNKEVGAGEWVLILTADHGATPFYKTSGAFVISPGKVGALIQNEFGEEALQFVQPTQVFLNVPYLESQKKSVEDVASFVNTIEKSQVAEVTAPAASEANDPAFQAAISADMLPNLPCLKAKD